MSASTAKQTRRDIRRAMGPQALDLVGSQAHAIAVLERDLTAHILTYEARDVRIAQCLRGADVLIAANTERIEALKNRGFWGRLRWLVRGT